MTKPEVRTVVLDKPAIAAVLSLVVFFDMLDLCVIALQGYAKLYPNELSGSAIDRLHYSPAEYAH